VHRMLGNDHFSVCTSKILDIWHDSVEKVSLVSKLSGHENTEIIEDRRIFCLISGIRYVLIDWDCFR